MSLRGSAEKRKAGKRNGFYINEPRVHLHMDEGR